MEVKKEFKRIPATVEQIAEEFHDLKLVFGNPDGFFDVAIKIILKQQVTHREIRRVVNWLLENHHGRLDLSDIVEQCETAKRNRLPDEVMWRKYPDGVEGGNAETAPDERKQGKFEE
jgi:hypothetical protein